MDLLRISNLSKSFKNIKAVDGIDFSVNKGDIIGLLGPNGAGKSTTISMISTLIKPDSGDILYNEKSIIKHPDIIQKKLGYIPQEIAIYPTLSGYENLKFWGKAYGMKGSKLKEQIKHVSKVIGINERLKDRVDKYSGGMKRRINIGVALMHNPEIIIMDEPTVGIDIQSRNHILETVKQLNKEGKTIIYTSHYMEEVEFLCNNICIMDNGKIIANGSKQELVNMIDNSQKIKIVVDEIRSDIINRLNSIESINKIDVEANIIKIESEKDIKLLNSITEVISDSDCSLISIEIDKPNLSSVFLHLTGKSLRD